MDFKRFDLLYTVVVLFLLVSCQNERSIVAHHEVGEALGTTYGIKYFLQERKEIGHSLDSLFQAVNRSMSTYHPDSDISRINDGDATIKVDQMFKDVFNVSDKVYESSSGYFDPTVGALVNAWGFGAKTGLKSVDSMQVDSLRQLVGWEKLQLNPDGTIQKTNPGIQLDFNAVAKGYCIDRIAVLLERIGCQDYLVEVGGEIVAKGINRSKEKPWRVGIDDPINVEKRGSAAQLTLKDRALASSGNYRKFRIDSLTGQKYVHTINPHSGYPMVSNVLSSSVLAKDCATADAFATAFMAMPLDSSLKWLKSQKEVDAMLIFLDGGEVNTYQTPGFLAQIAN